MAKGRPMIVEVYRDPKDPNQVYVASAPTQEAHDIVYCTGEWDDDGSAYVPPYINGSDKIAIITSGRHRA